MKKLNNHGTARYLNKHANQTLTPALVLLLLALSWICSTLSEFRFRHFVPVNSICSLSGFTSLHPYANPQNGHATLQPSARKALSLGEGMSRYREIAKEMLLNKHVNQTLTLTLSLGEGNSQCRVTGREMLLSKYVNQTLTLTLSLGEGMSRSRMTVQIPSPSGEGGTECRLRV